MSVIRSNSTQLITARRSLPIALTTIVPTIIVPTTIVPTTTAPTISRLLAIVVSKKDLLGS